MVPKKVGHNKVEPSEFDRSQAKSVCRRAIMATSWTQYDSRTHMRILLRYNYVWVDVLNS